MANSRELAGKEVPSFNDHRLRFSETDIGFWAFMDTGFSERRFIVKSDKSLIETDLFPDLSSIVGINRSELERRLSAKSKAYA